MKKKIATLEVWVDTDETEEVSCLQSDRSTGDYRILLHPTADKVTKRAEVATILAHELGHFVGYMMKSPWQICPVKQFGEREAWSIARKIKPDLDESLATYALNTYVETKCTCHRPDCRNRPTPKAVVEGLAELYELTKVA
jgi:hypothetical protein